MDTRPIRSLVTAMILIGSGCAGSQGEISPRGATLLTSKSPDGPGSTQFTALLPDVRLEIEGGCVVARASEGQGRSHSLVFPAGYSLGRQQGRAVILDAKKRTWATIGEHRSLGGGEMKQYEGAGVKNCAPPYWLVSTFKAKRRPGQATGGPAWNQPPPKLVPPRSRPGQEDN